jgi:hypothetical protein
VAAERSLKARAWDLFDRIVAEAAPRGHHTNPWRRADTSGGQAGMPGQSRVQAVQPQHAMPGPGRGSVPGPVSSRPAANADLVFEPDYAVLRRLLGVPLALAAPTTSGVPALALDVWVAYELRRAGLDPDAVWPRARAPRILPGPVARLLETLPEHERAPVEKRLAAGAMKGVAGASANILGKNYLKQVDVVMADWDTGPELLISTKRMDSSFGKNAANRVEESYGDAKNLRLRHPLAALGFVYGLRSTILKTEPEKAEWLIDLLQKLGREDDAYHAVGLLMIDYDDELALADGDDAGDGDDPLAAAGLEPDDDEVIEGQESLLDLLGTGFDNVDSTAHTGSGSSEVASAGTADAARSDGGAGRASADGTRQEPGSAVDGIAVPATSGGERGIGAESVPGPGDGLGLPAVRLLQDEVPPALQPSVFLAAMVERVLDATPVNRHREARRRRATVV